MQAPGWFAVSGFLLALAIVFAVLAGLVKLFYMARQSGARPRLGIWSRAVIAISVLWVLGVVLWGDLGSWEFYSNDNLVELCSGPLVAIAIAILVRWVMSARNLINTQQ